MRSPRTFVLALAGMLAAAGCGPTGPSHQLVDARRAYQEAQQSYAATLEPQHLLTARQTLERAERAHQRDPQSIAEKHLAYIAKRQAQMAMARGEATRARQLTQQYEERFVDLSEQRRRQAESRLVSTSAELEETRRLLAELRFQLEQQGAQLGETAQQLQEKLQTLEERERTLAVREAELQKEREARMQAEERASEALEALEAIAKVRAEERGVVITLSGEVLFEFDKSELRPIARQRLEQVARALEQQDGASLIVIEGHTDNVGTDAYNQQLSQRRAEAVRDLLIEQGLDPQRLRAVGKGESTPIAPNTTPEGRANNRRVEIVIQNQR